MNKTDQPLPLVHGIGKAYQVVFLGSIRKSCFTMATIKSVTLEGHHSSLRRHSFSAPPSLAPSSVHNCIVRVKELTGLVTQLGNKLNQKKVRDSSLLVPGPIQRSRSIATFNFSELSGVSIAEHIIEEIIEMSVFNSPYPSHRKLPQCHHCHAPLSNEVHVGVPSGVGRCSLDHWEGCQGGIPGGTGKMGRFGQGVQTWGR